MGEAPQSAGEGFGYFGNGEDLRHSVIETFIHFWHDTNN